MFKIHVSHTRWERLEKLIIEILNHSKVRGLKTLIRADPLLLKISNSIGIIAGSGKYSQGTFADIDITLEFTRSISSIFALYINTEFIRLKKAEQNIIQWNPVEDIKRIPMTLETTTFKYKKSK